MRIFNPPFISVNGKQGLLPLPIWRVFSRINRGLKPWVLIGAGTDCDGMRGGHESYHWTRRGALERWDSTCEWADGPMHLELHFRWSKSARSHLAGVNEWCDDRDRYAERMGY